MAAPLPPAVGPPGRRPASRMRSENFTSWMHPCRPIFLPKRLQEAHVVSSAVRAIPVLSTRAMRSPSPSKAIPTVGMVVIDRLAKLVQAPVGMRAIGALQPSNSGSAANRESPKIEHSGKMAGEVASRPRRPAAVHGVEDHAPRAAEARPRSLAARRRSRTRCPATAGCRAAGPAAACSGCSAWRPSRCTSSAPARQLANDPFQAVDPGRDCARPSPLRRPRPQAVAGHKGSSAWATAPDRCNRPAAANPSAKAARNSGEGTSIIPANHPFWPLASSSRQHLAPSPVHPPASIPRPRCQLECHMVYKCSPAASRVIPGA